ncbi:MAG: DPP IV N-terminal domain-containing protein, partial [Rhodothermales bacterium]
MTRPFRFGFGLLSVLVPLLLLQPARAQQATVPDTTGQRPLTLETIFSEPTFQSASFQGGRWAEEGPVLTYIEQSGEGEATDLVRYNLETDERTRLIDGATLQAPDVDRVIAIEDYQYSRDGKKVLLYTDSERVWRLNTKGYYYLYDVEAETLTPISSRDEGFQMFAKLSPDGSQVAFVRDRNLFRVDLASMEETQLTSDGAEGGIINGTSDWVYEEEFGLRDGWAWSPDGQYIAFLQLDETATREFAMTDLRGLYPEFERFRYPKAGEANSEIHAGVIDVESGGKTFFETGTWNAGGDSLEYIPQLGWTPLIDGTHYAYLFRMNRDQNRLDLLYGDPATGEIQTVLKETSETWLDVETGFSDLDVGTITFLEDGEHFVWISERDGHRHLYLYENDGTFVRQITQGDWDVTDFHGIDEAGGWLYFTSTEASPLERQFYRMRLDTADTTNTPERITEEAGWHDINLSSDARYFIDTFSDVTTPPTVTLR